MGTDNVKILGMGNALVDIIIKLDSEEHLDRLNLKKGGMCLVDACRAEEILNYFKDKGKVLATGGAASNTINAIASLSVSTAFIGCVGNTDEYGKFYIEDLLNKGVEPFFEKVDISTGTAITLMTPDSERTFATYLGAACTLGTKHLKAEFFQGYKYFHIEGYLVQNYELIETAMKMAKEAGCKVSFDMASFNMVECHLDFIKHIVKEYVDIAFVNEEEAFAFTGKNDMEALNIIGDLCEIAVVKLGSKGSLIKKDGKMYIIPPTKANCIDTNGAGDGYAAGMLYGLSKSYDLQKCGEIGSLIASKVVETIGPKLSLEVWDGLKPQM